MSLHVNVQGGTNAGRRRLLEHAAWECMCLQTVLGGNLCTVRKLNPGHRYSCPDCGLRRPAASNL